MHGVERVAALTGTISRGGQGPSRLTRVPADPEEGRVGKGKGAVETQRAPPLHAHKAGAQSAPAWPCSVQLSSVQSLSRVRLCDRMDSSTPGLPVHHLLPEFTHTHVH